MNDLNTIRIKELPRALMRTAEGRLTIVWIVSMMAIFTWSIFEDKYWEIWSFASIFMVLLYGVFIIIFNLRDMYRHLDNSGTNFSTYFKDHGRDTFFLIFFLLLLVALIVILAISIIDHISNPETDFRNLPFTNKLLFMSYKFSPFLIVCSFLGVDWFYYKIISKIENVEQIDKNEIIATIKLVDLPSVVSIFTINLFYVFIVYKNDFQMFLLEGNERNDLEIFMAGSGAFSLISFNIIFATISMFNALKMTNNANNGFEETK